MSIGALIGESITGMKILKSFSSKIAFNLFVGFFAKELTLGSLVALFGTMNLLEIMDLKKAAAFLIFYSFYTPCLPTVSAIYSELGKKYALASISWNLLVSFLLASIVMLI